MSLRLRWRIVLPDSRAPFAVLEGMDVIKVGWVPTLPPSPDIRAIIRPAGGTGRCEAAGDVWMSLVRSSLLCCSRFGIGPAREGVMLLLGLYIAAWLLLVLVGLQVVVWVFVGLVRVVSLVVVGLARLVSWAVTGGRARL